MARASGEIELTLPDAIGKAENLPSPPGVIVEVLRLSKDDDAGLDDFAQIISGDPALAAKLIKLSNSSMFSVGGEVKTLERACVLLGLKTVQLMALSFSLTNAAPESDAGTGFALKEYWVRSLIMAVAGRTFSNRVGYRLDDEAFLCGLLSQLGQLAILQCMPDAYRTVIERSEGAWPTHETETDVLGFDRSSIGAALLQSWGLPAPICLSIAYTHRPEELPDDANEEVRRLVDILRAAEQTVGVLRGRSKGEALGSLRAIAESAGIDAAGLDTMLEELEDAIVEMAEMLDVELESTASHAEILEDARQQVMRISLGTAADRHQAERRAHNLVTENRVLAEKASKDELTGIPNRAGFDEVLAAELEARQAGSRRDALGILMIDADHFKQFNDTHGHRAGDEVLRTIGRLLEQTTRDSDVPARYGGEEFAIIAPSVTPENLTIIAERLREAIELETIDFEGTRLQVTVSIGGACSSDIRSAADTARLIEEADQRLYRAKEDGRNRSVVEGQVLRLE
jgi:diguanylate cyclase (GGDEF)-like protein